MGNEGQTIRGRFPSLRGTALIDYPPLDGRSAHSSTSGRAIRLFFNEHAEEVTSQLRSRDLTRGRLSQNKNKIGFRLAFLVWGARAKAHFLS